MSKAAKEAVGKLRKSVTAFPPGWPTEAEIIIDAAFAPEREAARRLRDAAFASDCTCDAPFCDHFNALTEAIAAYDAVTGEEG